MCDSYFHINTCRLPTIHRNRTSFVKNTSKSKMRTLILLAFAGLALAFVAAEEKKIVCYVTNWSVYRPGNGQFSLDLVEPTLCTHMIYAFVGIDGDDVKVLDKWQDLPDGGGKDAIRRFNELRKKSPNTKTLIAIGGWNEGSPNYSAMASNKDRRARFVQNVVAFLKKHNFDGFDVDWEYPAQRGGASSDKENFVNLLKELREAFDKEGFLLSAAVGAGQSIASKSYNIREISKHLHFINLMAYDFHSAVESQTGMNAPLYAASSEVGAAKQLTVDAAVKYWLSQGAPKEKLIVGTATYGRAFNLANPNSADVGASSTGAGTAGPYTREAGMFGYNEICEFQKNEQWTVKYDEERRVPYAHRGNLWVGYDNIKSMKEKAEYIKKMNLGGAMVWTLDTDDFRGICGDKYPLLGALNEVLRNGKPVSDRAPQPSKNTHRTQKQYVAKNNNNNNIANRNVQNESGSGECTSAGNIADPTTCERFFQCVATSNGFIKYPSACPAGLCFNAAKGFCDWK